MKGAAILRGFDQAFYSKIVWLFLACLSGWSAATQPHPIVFIILVALGLFLLSLFTPFAALMGLLILAPLRTLIATEAAFQLPLDIGQIALFVALASHAIGRIARGQKIITLCWSPLFIPLLIFVFWTGASAFAALSLTAWLNEWLKWLQICILVALVLSLVRGNQWEWLLFGLVLSAVANALIGIYQFFGGSGALHLVINDRFFRAFGTFGQPNPFGGFMGLMTPLAVTAAAGYAFRLWRRRESGQKISPTTLGLTAFYALASILLLIGLVMSWSRGAWLGVAGAFAIMLIAVPRNAWHGVVLFGSSLGVFALLWLSGNLPATLVERLSSSTQEFFAFEDVRGVDITPDNFAVVERLAHWQAALNMANAHPWLGVGFGNYEIAYHSYQLLNWSEPLGHAHNYYLNILAEAGVLGLLGYGKVWGMIIWMSWRGRNHPDILARFTMIGLSGSWVYLNIHSLFDNLYVNNLFLHLGLMLGILAVLYNQKQSAQRLEFNGKYAANTVSYASQSS